jgi:hypothetical protein
MHLFHTASAHVARFDSLRDRIAPGLSLTHHIREDWLARARVDGMTPGLATEITRDITACEGAALCTCTTIGAVAEAAGAIRIDRPLMQAAARLGVPICLAYCLDSTAETSAALLQECIVTAQDVPPFFLLPLPHCWPLFEAGEFAHFSAAIAAAIRTYVAANPVIGCVVLAQASMDGAASILAELGLPVLSAPELAFRAALASD